VRPPCPRSCESARPYHARLRDELERFGGTVEKFIGDAVMAVFGAPVAHEDDAGCQGPLTSWVGF
jgi:class 3 adenylate cyclase